jgi:hypothetical protein
MSQYGQDKWALFACGYKRGGFFLDSGAGLGITHNNTFLLEHDYGWTGICVEPVPEFFDDLQKHRTCHCLKAALAVDGEDVGIAELVIPESQWLAGIEGHLPNDMWASYRQSSLRKVIVSTISTCELLSRFRAPSVIDYWSLDTEGTELAILQDFPWGKYTVSALSVEHNGVAEHRDGIRALLLKKNYQQVDGPDNGQRLYEDYFIKKLPAG